MKRQLRGIFLPRFYTDEMFLDSKATLDIEGQSNTLIEINFQLYVGHFCLVINLN